MDKSVTVETEGGSLADVDESVEVEVALLIEVWLLALHAASALSSPLAISTTTYRIAKQLNC